MSNSKKVKAAQRKPAATVEAIHMLQEVQEELRAEKRKKLVEQEKRKIVAKEQLKNKILVHLTKENVTLGVAVLALLLAVVK